MSSSFETPKVTKTHSSTVWQRTPSMSPIFSNTCRIGNDALHNQHDGRGADMSMNKNDQMNCNNHEFHHPFDSSIRENVQGTEVSKRTKEVDYYHNPTELFRWINYRRWDGAKARVHAHPEEASIWISSRQVEHSRIQWRYLSLHLVCMQSYVKYYIRNEHGDNSNVQNHTSNEEVEFHNQSLKDADLLVDELLRVYPQAAEEKDYEGMLPLHLCISRIDDMNIPNDKVIMHLLLSYPLGVHIRDNYGRTPLDLIRKKQETYPDLDRTLRTMLRASQMVPNTIQNGHRKDDNLMTPSLHHHMSEDDSSHRIMQKVEQQIVQEMSHSQDNIDTNELLTKISDVLKAELKKVKYDDYVNAEMELKQVTKEQDELLANRTGLRNEINNHDNVIAQNRRENNTEVEIYKQQLSSLRSEVSTTRAMAKEIEAQLRSKFSKKEDLSSVVNELEEKCNTLSAKSSRENKTLMDEIDELRVELKNSNALVKELTQKKMFLEKRNNDMERHVDRICSAFSSLLAQYDQAVESSTRNEAQLIKHIQAERSEYSASLAKLQKQLKLFDAFTADSRQNFIDLTKKETFLMEQFMDAKKQNSEAVAKIKSEFMDIRSKLTAEDYVIPVIDYSRNETKSKTLNPSEKQDVDDVYHEIENEEHQSPSHASFSQGKKDIDHRPYPKVKSPFLLEMLEQRALESTFKQTPTQEVGMVRSPKTPVSSSNNSKAVSEFLDSLEARQPNNCSRETFGEEDKYSHVNEKSISLDEYPDIESRSSVSSSVTTSDRTQNMLKGMRADVESDTVKVNQHTNMGEMSTLRSKYSSPKGR